MSMTWIGAMVLAAVLVAGLAVPPDAAAAANDGAFDRLSPGNQKIARAIFDAQSRVSNPPGTPLSLDDIAAMKASGGWGQVFHRLKAEGRVQDKNLGQAVSRFNHDAHAAARSGGTTITTASGKSIVTKGAGHSGQAADGTSAGFTTGNGNAGGQGGNGNAGGNSGHGGGAHGGGRGK